MYNPILVPKSINLANQTITISSVNGDTNTSIVITEPEFTVSITNLGYASVSLPGQSGGSFNPPTYLAYAEVSNPIDTLSYLAGVSLTDAFVASAQVTRSTNKGLSSVSYTSNNNITIVVHRNIELYNIGDVSDLVAKRLSRILTDTVGYLESRSLRLSRNVNEIVSKQDTFGMSVGYIRAFLESIKITDDYLAELNLDDDQYIRFGKLLIESQSTSETFLINVSFFRAVQENLVVTENVTKLQSSVLGDGTSTADTLRAAILKLNSDVVSAIENRILLIDTTLSDSTQVSEVAYKTFERDLVDYMSVVDVMNLVNLGITTLLGDSVSVSDNNSVFFRSRIEELLHAIELVTFDINKEVVSDVVTSTDSIIVSLAYVRELLEEVLANDLVSIGLAKEAILDVSLNTDTQTLSFNTLYVDVSYSFDSLRRDIAKLEEQLVNSSEYLSFIIGSTLADSHTAIEEISSKDIGTQLANNTVASSQLGSTLEMQSYTSGNYFAENYTGIIQNI